MDKKTSKDDLFPAVTEKSNPQSSYNEHPGTTTDEEAQSIPSGQDGSPPLLQMRVSKTKGVGVITTLAGINFLNTMGSGILIAALPRIAKDVGLSTTVYALAAGCLLHVFGSFADILGPKRVWVVGSFLFVVFTVALGFSVTGIQVIMFRTCLGIAMAMCLPTSVSLITNTFPKGHWRNTAFAMSGMAQPLGYALGLVLGGIFTDTIGWRWAYWIMAMVNFVISVISVWSLPDVRHPSKKTWARRLREDVDWVGVLILSVALALLMYVLAMITSDWRNVKKPAQIVLLVVSILLLVAFPLWMRRQVQVGKPALIPNRLWRKASFTSACLCVFFCWSSLNGIEYFTTLGPGLIGSLQSSIRYFSQIVMGTSVNIVLVYIISRVKVITLVVVSTCITLISPALMATVGELENYWFRPFWALFLCPVNPWVLFSVSNLLISDAFPAEIQSLAGGVFNEVAQFGNAVGLAVTAAIAASVTEHSNAEGKTATMDGYRAAFWTIFASSATVLIISIVGMRRVGTIGKTEKD
ncbi:hypothetical protein PG997_003043 [Apiospora hydei]|uniref:Major facilitator superfamily (MFS) profile domain-containing protein n=1 Tax=Apiospora hydei TaxID=1337664 RepID=A0ABR1WYB5_9PEZI